MNRGLRISYIDRGLWWGGAEECLSWMAAGMAARGHEVEIIVDLPLPHHRGYEDVGLTVLPRMQQIPWWAPERWAHPIKGLDRLGIHLRARWLAQYCAERRPDIVHFNLFRGRCRWDAMAARRSGAKIIGHLRQLRHQAMPAGTAFDLCDHVVAMSEFVRQQAMDAGCRVPLCKIYDGIDVHRFSFKGSVAEARDQLGLPSNALIIAFPAALEPRKGQDTALRAFRNIASLNPAAHLVFAGTRTALSGAQAYVSDLVRLSQDPAITGRVHFLGHCSDMAVVYAAADIVLALSHDGEAFGRIAAEAACAGKPVVATNVGATPEVVVDGVTGILVEPDNVEAVCSAIDRLMRDDTLRTSIARRAPRHAAELFDHERALDDFEALYGSLQMAIAA